MTTNERSGGDGGIPSCRGERTRLTMDPRQHCRTARFSEPGDDAWLTIDDQRRRVADLGRERKKSSNR